MRLMQGSVKCRFSLFNSITFSVNFKFLFVQILKILYHKWLIYKKVAPLISPPILFVSASSLSFSNFGIWVQTCLHMFHLTMKHTQKEISLDLLSLKSCPVSLPLTIPSNLYKLSPLAHISLLLNPLRFDIDFITWSELYILLKLPVASILMNAIDSSLFNSPLTVTISIWHSRSFLCKSSLCFDSCYFFSFAFS